MITATNIHKSFGGVVAVEDISFQVYPGDIVGFLGPNGAGKSTTMKMLTGFLAMDAGDISVNGLSIKDHQISIQKLIGYLPEGAPSYGDMTPFQMLNFIADVRELDGERKQKRIQDVIQQVDLGSVLDKPIDNLSKGFKRRVGLAQALLHDPKILILDEPTDGLDPNQKHQVHQLIKNLSKDKMVIVSTHILEEVSAVCNRAMIIAKGKVLFDGTPQTLQEKSKYHQAISLQFDSLPQNIDFLTLPFVQSVEVSKDKPLITLFPASDSTQNSEVMLQAVMAFLQQNSLHITGVYVEQGRIEEVFRSLTEDKTRGETLT